MLTPMDQIASQNHLQMMKAAVSYLPPRNQKILAVMLKIMEIQNLLRFYQNSSNTVSACSTASGPPGGMLDILSDMRNYCEGTEQAMLDQWIQVLSTMELYSMLAGNSEGGDVL